MAMEGQIQAIVYALRDAATFALHESVLGADVAGRHGREPLVVLLDLWDQNGLNLHAEPHKRVSLVLKACTVHRHKGAVYALLRRTWFQSTSMEKMCCSLG